MSDCSEMSGDYDANVVIICNFTSYQKQIESCSALPVYPASERQVNVAGAFVLSLSIRRKEEAMKIWILKILIGNLTDYGKYEK